MSLIDIHTHIGELYLGRKLEVDQLIRFMDESEIDKAVVLPIENPEETQFYVLTREVLQECKKYPDRLIPFCNVDPRHSDPNSFDPFPIIQRYIQQGCRGFGELLAGLPVDDFRTQRIYEICGNLGIPVLLHMDRHRNTDALGLPGFEEMLCKYPQTIFIAHGPHWWSEISGDVKEADKQGYPKGKVTPGGKVEYLLQKYPNVYGDLSAGSGYNAITRDLEFGKGFLERNKDKLLFGTDYLSVGQEVPIVGFIKNADLSPEAFEAITHRNAEKILKLC